MSTSTAADAAAPSPTGQVAPPVTYRGVAWLAVIFGLLTIVLTWAGLSHALSFTLDEPDLTRWLRVVVFIGTAIAVLLMIFPLRALFQLRRADVLAASGNPVTARLPAWTCRQLSLSGIGYAATLLVLVAFHVFLTTNNFAVQRAFLNPEYMLESAPMVLAAAKLNLYITLAASVVILILSLALALLRMIPGAAGRPIRWMVIAYVDFFRAVPTIIVIYLVGFGLPLTKIGFVSGWDGMWYAVLALSLSFSAYVTELFRSAIDSIHPSQIAAARSLGLTAVQAYAYVVVPQAFRRVIPPLLGFFVALQKDTALVLILGLLDVFGQAKYFAANFFNLSPVSVVGLLFFIITIPQTRFVDYLIDRQKLKGAR
jgi:polar amino acid transport system permease protein